MGNVPAAPPPAPQRRSRVWIGVGIVGAVLIAVVPVVLFSFGSDLFGSDRGAIDDYNRTVLESCELPVESTLVEVTVGPLVDPLGQPWWAMSFVYASPAEPEEVAAALGVDPGVEQRLVRPCRFGQRPTALVEPIGASTDPAQEPDLEVRERFDVPADSRSVVRLRLAQQEEEGVVR